jgi:transposase
MAESRARHARVSRRPSPTVLERINPDAAGLTAGVPRTSSRCRPIATRIPCSRFGTFTTDLHRLADWLLACRVTTVALESTGVFWIPVYEILEARGLTVQLVNARHVRNLPGRKSDVSDAEWLRDLHSVGLLRGSFRPTADIVALRTYLRHRHTLVELSAMHVQRRQKALVQMNLQLPSVVSDITGETGLRIIRAIVAGTHDPAVLATHRNWRCRATPAEIQAALTGHYRPELVFALQQNLELYDACQRQINACDQAIEAHVRQLTSAIASPGSLPPARAARQRIEPAFDVRSMLHHLTGGVDLTQIEGIGAYTALKVIAEIGTDMRRWPTAQHFTSWLTLAPKNKVSGGRLLGAQTQPSANRAAQAFRLAAAALGRTATALGAFYRRLAARLGKPHAVTATARKLAVLVYHVLKGDFIYKDPGAHAYEAHQRARHLRQLRKTATRLGFALVDQQTGATCAY